MKRQGVLVQALNTARDKELTRVAHGFSRGGHESASECALPALNEVGHARRVDRLGVLAGHVVTTCLALGLIVALGESCPAGESLPFVDGFEQGLRGCWRVRTGEPKAVSDPDKRGGQVLELGPSSKLMLRTAPVQDVVVEARVRFAEDRQWVEAPVLLRSDASGARAVQVYLEQKSSQVMAVRYDGGAHHLAAAATGPRLEIGQWYALKIAAIGPRIVVWLNDRRSLVVRDRQVRRGLVGLRVGDARTLYDDVRVRAPQAEEREAIARIAMAGRPVSTMRKSIFSFPDGSQVVLRCPERVEPLTPFEVTVTETTSETADRSADYLLIVAGQSVSLRPDEPKRLRLSGPEGVRTFRLMRNGRPIGTTEVILQGDTYFEAGELTPLFEQCRDRVHRDRQAWRRRGTIIHTNPSWFRDHVHEMKAYKYWEGELCSYVDALLELQHPEGFYYEILGRADHDHQTFVDETFVRVERDQDLCWIRLEMEADIEYLMVEAVHAIWRATGDGAALRRRLPSLERALEYGFTHPTRWDAEHGAMKRTFSIDTWDFTYGVSDRNRRIEPDMPMGIMHGDNSGLYQACRQLARMLHSVGEPTKAQAWDKRARELRERVNELCFNGRYYTHQVLLDPVDTGVDEADILSLSNTYDINRGLPTHEMAVKIIDEYRARRAKNADRHFAEWYSIDPPYPQFGPYPAGKYINGGVAGFVAGELAKAALHHGREAYGADILRRVARKVADDGFIGFLYDAKTGQSMGGGPRGWSAAAVISALLEGLAGIEDRATRFRHVTLSPRFVAAGIDEAKVCARYGPSGAYVTMAFEHDPDAKTIRLRVAGVSEHARLRVLLPEGAVRADVVEPERINGWLETVASSRYLAFDWMGPLAQGVAAIRIAYETD